MSFLHISRSEVDLGAEVKFDSEIVYDRAKQNFQKWIRECPFLTEDKPALYIYRLKMGNHEQTGLVGTFSINEYDQNLIKKHEKTRPDKEDDRTRHILELSAQTGPVYLAYKNVPALDREIQSRKAATPLYDFVASDGIAHTLWKVENYEFIVECFKKEIQSLYIADGHHRAAAASRVRKIMAEKNPKQKGDEDYNYFLAVAFPENQLQILPYHRVIKDLGSLSENEFLEKLGVHFEITHSDRTLPPRGELGMFFRNQWYRLVLKGDQARPHLDVSLLQDLILGPILGIHNVRTDKRIDFVGGIRGTTELEKWVNSGKAALAFSLHPTQLRDVMEIADQGGIMPPKSTWFEPKLRDGLFTHKFENN